MWFFKNVRDEENRVSTLELEYAEAKRKQRVADIKLTDQVLKMFPAEKTVCLARHDWMVVNVRVIREARSALAPTKPLVEVILTTRHEPPVFAIAQVHFNRDGEPAALELVRLGL